MVEKRQDLCPRRHHLWRGGLQQIGPDGKGRTAKDSSHERFLTHRSHTHVYMPHWEACTATHLLCTRLSDPHGPGNGPWRRAQTPGCAMVSFPTPLQRVRRAATCCSIASNDKGFLQRWRDVVAARGAGTARQRRSSSWCIGRCDAAHPAPPAHGEQPTRPVASSSPGASSGTAAATGCQRHACAREGALVAGPAPPAPVSCYLSNHTCSNSTSACS